MEASDRKKIQDLVGLKYDINERLKETKELLASGDMDKFWEKYTELMRVCQDSFKLCGELLPRVIQGLEERNSKKDSESKFSVESMEIHPKQKYIN